MTDRQTVSSQLVSCNTPSGSRNEWLPVLCPITYAVIGYHRVVRLGPDAARHFRDAHRACVTFAEALVIIGAFLLAMFAAGFGVHALCVSYGMKGHAVELGFVAFAFVFVCGVRFLAYKITHGVNVMGEMRDTVVRRHTGLLDPNEVQAVLEGDELFILYPGLSSEALQDEPGTPVSA